MNKLLGYRQRIRQFYAKWEPWIEPALKGLTMLFIILVINTHVGYSQNLQSWNAVLLTVLVAALLPWKGLTFISAVWLLINTFAMSWEVAFVTAALILICAVAQYIFLPGFSLAAVLIPVAFCFKIPYMVPLILGLVGGTLTFIPASAGVLMYYFLLGVEKNADVFMRTTGSASGALERFPQIISILQDNDVMLISIIAFAAATVIVSVIRRISTDYSMYIAVAVGAVVNVMIFLVGGFTSDANIAYAEVFLGSVISLLIAFAAAFWLVAADYAHAEYLQYEDEGYIYYVRAVPKIKIAKKAVKIHDVSPQDTEEDENRDIEEALKALDAIDEEERKKESR
ncbi:MAG: hypothetical protein IJS22_02140 [Lachnospiraceae bacterium]|nr:hypothetical protein [Lachnospiraceae bacterium]